MARKSTKSVAEKQILTKRDRFLKYAPTRTQNVIDAINILSNCSNTNNYEYTQEEIDKIFNAISSAMDEAKAKFYNKKSKDNKFSF